MAGWDNSSAHSHSRKARNLGYAKWLVLGLVIGLGLRYGDEIQHNAEPLWNSVKKWGKRVEFDKLQAWLSSPQIKQHTRPVFPQSTNPPGMLLPNIQPQRNADSSAVVELILRPGENGHFFTTVQINGHSVNVMVDTGASFVSIPANLQTQLELPMGRPMTFTTASDRYISHETTIRYLVLGPILLQNIKGDLNPRSPDGKILLGMSALKNLELLHKNNTLTLRAPRSMAVMNNPSQINTAGTSTELLTIKRSVRECMGEAKMLDQKALECIKGN